MATLYRQALSDLNAAIDLDPRDITALTNRAFIWETLGELDKALIDYSRAIELNPTNPAAYLNRGNVYLKRADYYNAAIDETVAIQLDSELCEPIAYFYRAQAYRGLQRWNEASADYQRYIDRDPQGFYVRAAQAYVIAIDILIKPEPARPTEALPDSLHPISTHPVPPIDAPAPIEAPPSIETAPESDSPAATLITAPPSPKTPQWTETVTAAPAPIDAPQPTDTASVTVVINTSPTDSPHPAAASVPKFTARIGDFIKIPSVERIISHLRIPLFANGYALVFSSGAVSALGLLYWVIAAHLYSMASIGLNSAAISVMTFLGTIAQLNLGNVLTRFIPRAGRSTGRWVAGSYLISTAMSVVISAIFYLGLGFFSPELNAFLTGPGLALWFVFATSCWTIINIQDGVLTGLRQAIWVPVKNTGFGIAKILLLFFFAGAMPITGVFASWAVGTLLVILPAGMFIFLRLLPKRAYSGEPSALGLSQVTRYAIGDYFGALCVLGSTTLLPVLVLKVAGEAENAYFYIASTIGFTLYSIGLSMGLSLTVEAVHDQAKLSIYSWKVFLQTLRFIVPLAGVFIIGAPLILRVFGDNYAVEGSLLLQLLALSAIPNVVNALYISVARAQGRSGVVFVVSALLSGSVLVLSYIFLVMYGIAGVGLAWIVGQGVCAVVLLITQFRPLWTSRIQDVKEIHTGSNPRRSITASTAVAENNG